jgi:hypothetical protein
VPLLVAEPHTQVLRKLHGEDPDAIVWWNTEAECASAIARLERERHFDTRQVAAALERLASLSEIWHEVAPTQPVKQLAERLLRVHPLRSADALQLAAATVASEQVTASLPFVCLDARLAEAARREGFQVLDLGT